MLCLSPELRMCSAESRAEATLRSAARPQPALMVVERPMQSPLALENWIGILARRRRSCSDQGGVLHARFRSRAIPDSLHLS